MTSPNTVDSPEFPRAGSYMFNSGESIYYTKQFDDFIKQGFTDRSVHFEEFCHQEYEKISKLAVNIANFLDNAKYFIISHTRAAIFNRDVFIRISCSNQIATCSAFGDIDAIAAVKKKFQNVDENKQRVHWYYARSGGGMDYIEFLLDKTNTSKDWFYPQIEGGIAKYFEAYKASDSQILIMAGPPGTGKTSLIRTILKQFKLNAMTTYDSDVMRSDEFYLDFMSDEDMNVLVVEDADTLLESRDTKGNKILSKILNASDGIIKLSGKKIIFTTNIENKKDIDPALMRPGRCFDYLSFRAFTAEEADAICKREGLEPVSSKKKKREYTLADIFNQSHSVQEAQKMGII